MGIELIIENSYSQVKGLKSQDFKELKGILSYTKNPEAAYYRGGFISKTYMIDKQGRFPTGLYHIVVKWLDSSPMSYEIVDKRVVPKSIPGTFPIPDIKPYDWQDHAVEVALVNRRGGVVAPTGTGKSLVIALIAVGLQVRTLVVVPTVEIKVQLMADIKKLFGSLDSIRIENIDASALETDMNFDCLIIDECHHAAAKTYQRLNKRRWNGIYYRFFLSATYFRNNTNETLPFEAICGEEIYRLTYRRAVEAGYIVPIEAYYYDLPKKENDLYTWREVFSELVIRNDERNKLIADILQDLHLAGKSCICLVKEIEHGEILAGMTGFPFVNGQDEASRRHIAEFKSGEIHTLIGTEGILGEGVDLKSAEYVIITGLGKAKSAFMQKIGRVTRTFTGKTSGKVVFFRDSSHKFSLTHWRAQCRILKEEYGVIPTKL